VVVLLGLRLFGEAVLLLLALDRVMLLLLLLLLLLAFRGGEGVLLLVCGAVHRKTET